MNNSPFLQALRRKKNDVPPIWFMRQAGRYLPEYQKIRKNYKNFLDMCKEPRTCAELALQPIERFDIDIKTNEKQYHNRYKLLRYE